MPSWSWSSSLLNIRGWCRRAGSDLRGLLYGPNEDRQAKSYEKAFDQQREDSQGLEPLRLDTQPVQAYGTAYHATSERPSGDEETKDPTPLIRSVDTNRCRE